MNILLKVHDTNTEQDTYKLFKDELDFKNNKHRLIDSFLEEKKLNSNQVILECIYPEHKECVTTYRVM